MCLQHPVQSSTYSGCLEPPPPSNDQSATLLWGSFHSVGSAIVRGFAQTQTLGFGPLWLGTDVCTPAHSYTPWYMKCYIECLIAGCNIVTGERKTGLSIAYSLADMTENIDCSSHLPGTFITLWYRRGDDWEVGTCQLTSGTCPSTTRDLRYVWGLKFHYRF